MNEYERQRRIAENTKKLYPPGTRIELISMKDPYAPVPTGTRGTVKFVDSMGTIFPEWDNGRSLGVVPGEDSFRKLTQEEIEARTVPAEPAKEAPAKAKKAAAPAEAEAPAGSEDPDDILADIEEDFEEFTPAE